MGSRPAGAMTSRYEAGAGDVFSTVNAGWALLTLLPRFG